MKEAARKRPSSADPLKRRPAGDTASRAAVPKGVVKGVKQGTYVRVDGSTVKKKTFYFPEDFATEFAVYCAQNGVEESFIVVEALREKLKGG